METHISSEIRIDHPTQEVMKWCLANLVLTNPEYTNLVRMGKQDTIYFRKIPQKVSFYRVDGESVFIPFGCIYSVYPMIKGTKVTSDFAPDMEISIKDKPLPKWISLYDYQESAVSDMVKYKGGVLTAGCGSGKTISGIEIIHRIGLRFLWIVHTKDLMVQARNDFLRIFPDMDIGLITDGKFQIGKDGAIATVQTLSKLSPSYYAHSFNVVVVDECHHCAESATSVLMYQKVLMNMNPRYRYGLTATPYRRDGLINTIYFNLGCNPSGEFAPTHSVPREAIKSLDARVESLNVDTPIAESYDVMVKQEGKAWVSSDENGCMDLSRFSPRYDLTKIVAGYDAGSVWYFRKMTDRKKDTGVSYHSDTHILAGLMPSRHYCLYYSYDVRQQKYLIDTDGTIDFASLVGYLTHNRQRNEKTVDYICDRVNEGRKVAVLSQTKDHCRILREMLLEKGVRVSCVTGDTKDKERKEALANPESWDVIVATVSLFKEGIDIKALDTVIIASPIKDSAVIEQSCGRCERYVDGKADPLFVYVLDTTFPYCQGVMRKIRSVIRKRK